MVNIAEILKNAPKGLKLYSLAHGDVTLEKVIDSYYTNYPIVVLDSNANHCCTFTKYGNVFNKYNNAECILFPSKEHKSWDNWQKVLFKVGDIVTNPETKNTFIIIFKNDLGFNAIDKSNLCHTLWYINYRYATQEEREQFLKELNDNGYTWNDNTKQMEKSVQNTPKYKVGDWLYDIDHGVIQITDIIGGNDGLYCFNNECQNLISLTDKFSRLATEQELVDAGIKEKPFTIDDFKPFDKVLVRDYSDSKWGIELFERYDIDSIETVGQYLCLSNPWKRCIPYNDETKHLLGTADDAPDKYKTW